MPQVLRFLYLAPADMVGLQGGASGPAEFTYNVNWITDGLPGRPVRALGTSATWVVTGSAKPINFVALINSNVDAGATVTTTAGATVMPSYAGRVPLNPYAVVLDGAGALAAGTSGGSVSVAISSNSQTVVAGLIVGGTARELERPIAPGGGRQWTNFNKAVDPQMGNIAVSRTDKAARLFTGTTVLTTAGVTALQAWYDSTNDGELPSIIVPDPLLNDAWCVKFNGFQWEKQGPEVYTVTLAFAEYPRVRW